MRDDWGMIPDDELEDLFREAAEGFKPQFEPEAWRRMEAKLDDQQQAAPARSWRRFGWLSVLLLLLLGSTLYLTIRSSSDFSTTAPTLPAHNKATGPANTTTRTTTPKNQHVSTRPTATDRRSATDPADSQLANQQTVPAGEAVRNDVPRSGGATTERSLAAPTVESTLPEAKAPSHKATQQAPVAQRSSLASIRRAPTTSTTKTQTDQTTTTALNSPLGSLTTSNSLVTGRSKANARQTFTTPRKQKDKTIPLAEQVSEQASVKPSGDASQTATSTLAPGAAPQPPSEAQRLIIEVASLATKLNLPQVRMRLPAVAEPSTAPIAPPPARTLRQRWGLRLITAPDLNHIVSTNPMAWGSSVGLSLEYQLARRLRVQVGAIRSDKPYALPASEYYVPSGTWKYGIKPEVIDADCKILDLPVNIRWDALRRPRYDFFVSTGLSSYLMLNERYDYTYATGINTTHLPMYWQKKRASDHWLSTYNLSVGYERQLKRGFTLQVEPYLKMPLKGVGFGNVHILSTGVYVSAKYQFGKVVR